MADESIAVPSNEMTDCQATFSAGLAFDAKADGYEFGGGRVKKPQKRRLAVQHGATVH